MKLHGDSAMLEKECAALAKAPKPKWDSALTAFAIVLGRNGYRETDVIGPAKAACQKNGCLEIESQAYVEKKIRDGLAEGERQALSLPARVNGAVYAGEPKWRERRGNRPVGSFHNAKLGIAAMGLKIRRDIFHDVMILESADAVAHDVAPLVGEVTDPVLLRLRDLFSERYGFDAGENHIWHAVQASAVVFNPVADMIDAAQAAWDKKPRLDRMAADNLSAEDTELNSIALRKHMVAAVRRVRQPGCKYDVMIVLEGPEGWNKSTAICTIAGSENFSDEPILGAKGKEAMELLRIVWHHECAELTGIRKAEVEHVKAFLSRTFDMHRQAYGRVVTRQPRHSVEWGTTNDSQYLVSQSGNRRFAPLRLVRSIDLDKLARDRLQLIGEAAHHEAKGESLFIPESLWPLARAEQEKRREPDPWEARLAHIPDAFVHREGDGRERVAAADLMSNVLQIPAAQQSPAMGKRIRQAMEINGWEYPENPIKISGRNQRGYWRWGAK